MVYRGQIKNGVVVIEAPEGAPVLAEGTAVIIEPVVEEQTIGQKLLKYAGRAEGLPADFAENHDHYIRGTPRK